MPKNLITEVAKIKDGVPWTYGDEALFSDLAKEDQTIALAWIKANFLPRKTPLNRHTSYGLKHKIQKYAGIYMTNNQFKHAMLLAGFNPVNESEKNWSYCISKKSPGLSYKDDVEALLYVKKPE